jgi:hypothetical protein
MSPLQTVQSFSVLFYRIWISRSQDIYKYFYFFFTTLCFVWVNYTRKKKYDCQSWVMETLYLLWWLWNRNSIGVCCSLFNFFVTFF